MSNVSKITDEQLINIKQTLENNGIRAKAWQIAAELKKQFDVTLDDSTIRGRFIMMNKPLRGQTEVVVKKEAIVKEEIKKTIPIVYNVPEELKKFIPPESNFSNYIVRPIDKRLELHYELNKYPLTQGKQGTGKTTGHQYYAMIKKLPFFEFCCHPDFKLHKLFGDKTIKAGNVEFVESLLVKAIQNPSVVLFDEINRLDEKEGAAFHSLLASRKLFVKDADNGNGKWYQLHKDCKIGFAMNPKSAKYVGTQTKNSAFVGRCTFLTYPEFDRKEIKNALLKKFPDINNEDLTRFIKFYFACIETIERSEIPVDISIRQLNNVVELWLHGMPLKDAIEDGMTSILEAVSQPKAKESFFRLAQAVWKELMEEQKSEQKPEEPTLSNFLMRLKRRRIN